MPGMTPRTIGRSGPAGGGAGAPAALEVSSLSISAGSLPLVRDVSFTVAAGARVGVIGASGSGKTLTCMAVAGLLPPELMARGSVRIAGTATDMVLASEKELARVRGRLTGMVFQEPMTALNPTMRIDRQILEAMRVHRARTGAAPGRMRVEQVSLTRVGRRASVVELLQSVGLDDTERIARSFPHELSGGQRQRVVLAIALVNDPALLICDEPTTALDVSVQATVLELIDERLRALGSALLFVSHDLAVVASLCDEVLVMWQGAIVERGPVTRVLTAPQHEHTRRLLADADLTLGLRPATAPGPTDHAPQSATPADPTDHAQGDPE